MNLLKLTLNNLQSMDVWIIRPSELNSAKILIYNIRIHRQAAFFERL